MHSIDQLADCLFVEAHIGDGSEQALDHQPPSPLICIQGIIYCTGPVSYTHLDVYKRQKQETLYFLQNHSLSLDELNVIAVMDDAAALKCCIALGMGISILSRATVQTDAQQGRLLLFPL